MLLDRVYAWIARSAGLLRILRPVGGPIYRWLVARYARYVAWRADLAYPTGTAPAALIQYSAGTFEPETSAIFRRLLQPGAVCVDVGANLGYYTRLAATLVGPHGRVIACEPAPENAAALRANIRPYPQATLVAVALAATQGLLPLYLSSHASCHSLIDRHFYKDGASLWVPTLTFDQLAEVLGLTQIDLVKVDVEGAEALVLQGMRASLSARAIQALIIEFSPYAMLGANLDPLRIATQLLGAFDQIAVIEAPDSALVGRRLADVAAFTVLGETLQLYRQRGYVNLLCQRAPIPQR